MHHKRCASVYVDRVEIPLSCNLSVSASFQKTIQEKRIKIRGLLTRFRILQLEYYLFFHFIKNSPLCGRTRTKFWIKMQFWDAADFFKTFLVGFFGMFNFHRFSSSFFFGSVIFIVHLLEFFSDSFVRNIFFASFTRSNNSLSWTVSPQHFVNWTFLPFCFYPAIADDKFETSSENC